MDCVQGMLCRFGVERRSPRFKELKDVWGKFEALRRCVSAIGEKHFGLLRETSDLE